MRLGCKVDDGTWLMLCQQAIHEHPVTDVALHKMMPGILGKRDEVVEIACVGQLVEIDDRLVVVG